MTDSIFTKIIKGEIPCHKVYEDDRVIAFLDIHPVTEGHTLVVPKQQIDSIWSLDDELYQHIMATAKKIANRIQEVIKPPRVGVMVEGFEVPHAHYHVLPLYKGFKLTMAEYNTAREPNHAKLAETAKKLQLS